MHVQVHTKRSAVLFSLAVLSSIALLSSGLVAAQETCPCPPPAPPPPLWTGSVGLSYLATSGDTDTQTSRVAASWARQPTPWGMEITALADRAESDGVTTAERYYGGVRGKRAMGERFELFGGLSYERNEFAGFDSRVLVEAGGVWKSLAGPNTARLRRRPHLDPGDPVAGDGRDADPAPDLSAVRNTEGVREGVWEGVWQVAFSPGRMRLEAVGQSALREWTLERSEARQSPTDRYYPGSFYELSYDPKQDLVAGVYHQLALRGGLRTLLHPLRGRSNGCAAEAASFGAGGRRLCRGSVRFRNRGPAQFPG